MFHDESRAKESTTDQLSLIPKKTREKSARQQERLILDDILVKAPLRKKPNPQEKARQSAAILKRGKVAGGGSQKR